MQCGRSKWQSPRWRTDSTFWYSRFAKDCEGGLEPRFRSGFGSHFTDKMTEYLHTKGIAVANPVQRLQEAGQIDYTLTGHESLVIASLFGRHVRGIVKVNMDNSVATCLNDVLWCCSRPIPMPGIH